MRRSRRSDRAAVTAWARMWATRARRALADDTGSASLEFISVGLLMLVPLVYLVLTLSAVQGAVFAVEGAARQASRVFVQAADVGAGEAAIERAVAITLADYGLEPGAADVRVSCRPNPGDCLERHGFVTVEVGVSVPLPLLPPVLDVDLPGLIPVDAIATEQVSRFRDDG